MFVLSAELADFPPVLADDQIVWLIGVAFAAMCAVVLTLDAPTRLSVPVTLPANAVPARANERVGFIKRVSPLTVGAIAVIVSRSLNVFGHGRSEPQVLGVNASTVRTCHPSKTIGLVMTQVVNGVAVGNRTVPMGIGPTVSQQNRPPTTAATESPISKGIDRPSPFQASIWAAYGFGQKARLRVIMDLLYKKRVAVALPTGVVLATPATCIRRITAARDQAVHKWSIAQVLNRRKS